MKRTAIFTTSSNNYFAFSRTLLESVRAFHDDVDIYFLLVDETPDNQVLAAGGFFRVCCAKDIGIPEFTKMAFAYNIVEFNTAVKPFFIHYLLSRGYDKVVYLDPDILVFNRLDTALDALETHSIVVTPHQLAPLKDLHNFTPYLQWEQSALQTGIFNLGFLGVSNTDEGRAFIKWWSNRCSYLCFLEQESGLFVDQIWVNLAVCFYRSVHIVRHKGYNMSVWNLHDRTLIDNRVNGVEPLVFYHFSSIDMNNRSVLSKHDASMTLERRPDLTALFDGYRSAVNSNGYEYFRRLRYSYDCFSDGRRITLLERRLYAAVSDHFSDPFACSGRRFSKELSKAGRLRSHSPKRDEKLTKRIVKAGLRTIFKVFGPARYARLVQSFRGLDRLRNHVFLVD